MTSKSQSFKDILNLKLELLNKEAYLRREEFYDSSGLHSSTIKGFCTVSLLKKFRHVNLNKLDIDLMGVSTQKKYSSNPKKHNPKLVDSKVFQIHSTYNLRGKDTSLAVYTYPLEFNLTDDMIETVDLVSNKVKYYVRATLYFNKNKLIIVKIPIKLIRSVKYSDPVLMEANWKNLLKYEILCDDNVLYLDDEISVDFLFRPKFPQILLKSEIIKLKNIKLYMIQTHISSSIDDHKTEHVSYQRLRFSITSASFANGNRNLVVTENGDWKFNMKFKLFGLQHLNSPRRLHPSFYNKNVKFSVQHQLKASVEFDVKDYKGLTLPWNLDDDSATSTANNDPLENALDVIMRSDDSNFIKLIKNSPELTSLRSQLLSSSYKWKSCGFSVRLPLILLPAGSKDGNVAPPNYADIVTEHTIDETNSSDFSCEDLTNSSTDEISENYRNISGYPNLLSTSSPCSSTSISTASSINLEEFNFSAVKTIFKQFLFKKKLASFHVDKALLEKHPPNYCFV